MLDSSSALLVDIVFGFQTLQQRLEERLVRFRSSADGLIAYTTKRCRIGYERTRTPAR